MKLFAHRGIFNNKDVPENSLKAFEKALYYHIPIELDIQLTIDNILVVFHDFNLKRMTGSNKLLQDCSYSELNKLFLLNTKEKIPTLQEVLNLVQGKVLLNIEIKNTKRIKDTCNILMKELKNYSPFVLQSFHPGIVHFIKNNYPNTIVGYLIGDKKTYSNSFYFSFLSHPLILNYCKPDFLSVSKELRKKKCFKKWKEKYSIYLWTIKKREELRDDNISYICENLPYSSK